MARLNLSTLFVAILCGWACLWSVGWASSWPVWWVGSVVAFFLGSSLIFGWAFFHVEGPESDR